MDSIPTSPTWKEIHGNVNKLYMSANMTRGDDSVYQIQVIFGGGIVYNIESKTATWCAFYFSLWLYQFIPKLYSCGTYKF